MSSVTVSPKFQVVIPKDVRDRMRLSPGLRFPSPAESPHASAFDPSRPQYNRTGPGGDGGVQRQDTAGAGRAAGMAIDKYLKDGEWWDPNAPKSAEAAPAAK